MSEYPTSIHWYQGFLTGAQGPLHCLHLHPVTASSDTARRGLVFCQPLGDELNRSRRTVRQAAVAFAEQGHEVLVVDLYGTGDSAGDFVQATWDVWLQDLVLAAGWLREARGIERIVFWGLRIGTALAVQAARIHPCERLLLWQPVVGGHHYLAQFLRQSSLTSTPRAQDGQGDAASELLRILGTGKTIEVDGYPVRDHLCQALEAVDLLQTPPNVPVHWTEVVPDVGRPFAAASRKLIEVWEGAGVWMDDTKVTGPGFWSAADSGVNPGLIEHARELGMTWREPGILTPPGSPGGRGSR